MPLLHTQWLPSTIAEQAIHVLVRHGIQPAIHHFIEQQEEIWTGPAMYDTPWIAGHLSSSPHLIKRFDYKKSVSDLVDPLRIVAYAPEALLLQTLPEIASLQCSWNITRSKFPGVAALAIMHHCCHKAEGVRQLAHYFEVGLEHVMAIGDDMNDCEMLEMVGWGVAMGQSHDKVKASAQVITTSNDEDGAALAIEKYALYTTNS